MTPECWTARHPHTPTVPPRLPEPGLGLIQSELFLFRAATLPYGPQANGPCGSLTTTVPSSEGLVSLTSPGACSWLTLSPPLLPNPGNILAGFGIGRSRAFPWQRVYFYLADTERQGNNHVTVFSIPGGCKKAQSRDVADSQQVLRA